MGLEIETGTFERKARRFEAALLARSETSLSEYAGAAAARLQQETPPFTGGRSDGPRAAFNRGLTALTARVFTFVQPGGPDDVDAGVVLKNWRTLARPAHPRRVRPASIRTYLNRVVPTIGHAAGGWNEALSQLGFDGEIADFTRNVPGRGSFSFARTPAGVRVEFSDDVAYLADLSGVAARMNYALKMLSGEERWRFESLLLASAEKAGFR